MSFWQSAKRTFSIRFISIPEACPLIPAVLCIKLSHYTKDIMSLLCLWAHWPSAPAITPGHKHPLLATSLMMKKIVSNPKRRGIQLSTQTSQARRNNLIWCNDVPRVGIYLLNLRERLRGFSSAATETPGHVGELPGLTRAHSLWKSRTTSICLAYPMTTRHLLYL